MYETTRPEVTCRRHHCLAVSPWAGDRPARNAHLLYETEGTLEAPREQTKVCGGAGRLSGAAP